VLCGFSSFQFFFLVSVIVISVLLVFLSQASYLSHNRLFLDFLLFFFSFSVLLKTFWVSFTLCARLTWQLACQFSSANHLQYRIVSYRIIAQQIVTQNICMLKFSKRWCDLPVFSSMSMRNSGSSMLVIASSRAFMTSSAWFSSAWLVPRSALSTERNCSNIAITSARVSNILQTTQRPDCYKNYFTDFSSENQ